MFARGERSVERLLHMSQKFRVAVAAAVSLMIIATGPSADAAAKKKKKVTTKKVKIEPTVATTLPPAPTVATTLPPAPTVATVPPTTLSQAEFNRQGFARMFTPRDRWGFVEDVQINLLSQQVRLNINKSVGAPLYVASAGRVMVTTNDNRGVALIIGLVADPALASPELLKRVVNNSSASLVESKVLNFPGGAGVVGIDDGDGIALVAFDQFFIQVIAESRQAAQDAAFVVSANMGYLLKD
jgi:hypothetical protein